MILFAGMAGHDSSIALSHAQGEKHLRVKTRSFIDSLAQAGGFIPQYPTGCPYPTHRLRAYHPPAPSAISAAAASPARAM